MRGLGRCLVERFLKYTLNTGLHLVGVSEATQIRFYRACGMQVAEGAAAQFTQKVGIQADTHFGEGLILTACPFVEAVLAGKISIGLSVKSFLQAGMLFAKWPQPSHHLSSSLLSTGPLQRPC